MAAKKGRKINSRFPQKQSGLQTKETINTSKNLSEKDTNKSRKSPINKNKIDNNQEDRANRFQSIGQISGTTANSTLSETWIELIVIMILAGIYIFILLPPLLNWTTGMINGLFGNEKLWINLMAGGVAGLGFCLFIWLGIIAHNWYAKTAKKQSNNQSININNWGMRTIFGIILSVSVGVSFIYAEFGPTPLQLKLRDAGSYQEWGNISCSDNSGNLLSDNLIFCKINPSVTNISGKIVFDYFNGTKNESFLSNELSFIAPEQVKRITFYVNGFDKNSIRKNLETSSEFTFLNEQELSVREKDKLTYSLALIGVVLFSIPSMMKNMKELFKE